MCLKTYKKPFTLHRRHYYYGKTLLPSQETSGFVGLYQSKHQKQEKTILKEQLMSLLKVKGGCAVGVVANIAKTA